MTFVSSLLLCISNNSSFVLDSYVNCYGLLMSWKTSTLMKVEYTVETRAGFGYRKPGLKPQAIVLLTVPMFLHI